VKGEITLLIGKPPDRAAETRPAAEVFRDYLNQGLSRMDAMKAAARDCGLSKREVYAALQTEP
jgi:16S rRNA C1402 (ribose-2'-O) methylase RsmI